MNVLLDGLEINLVTDLHVQFPDFQDGIYFNSDLVCSNYQIKRHIRESKLEVLVCRVNRPEDLYGL